MTFDQSGIFLLIRVLPLRKTQVQLKEENLYLKPLCVFWFIFRIKGSSPAKKNTKNLMGWNLCNRLNSTEEYFLKMRIKDHPNENDNLLNNW